MPTWLLHDPIGASVAAAGSALVTLKHKPSFVITEFLGTSDSLKWKQHMLKLGFEDVTPLHGKKKGVVTFDKLKSEDWAAYQAAMVASPTALNADWQYFSGHHASHIYSGYIDANYDNVLNTHDDCGFFNEAYHHGTWEDRSERPHSVYMCTSRTPPTAPLGPNDSFFLKGTPATAVKGVIANGCNTFSFRHTRMWLRETFPNAVIFGFLDKTPKGPQAIFPLIGGGGRRGVYQDDPKFWRDPKKRFLDAKGAVDETAVRDDVRALNLIYFQATNNTKFTLAMMIEKRVYSLALSTNPLLTTDEARIRAGNLLRDSWDFEWPT